VRVERVVVVVVVVVEVVDGLPLSLFFVAKIYNQPHTFGD